MSGRWKNLSFRLPLFALFISVAPLVVFGLFVDRFDLNVQLETQGRVLQRSSAQAASAVQLELGLRESSLKNGAENLELTSLDKEDQEWALISLLSQQRALRSLSLLDNEGRERLKLDREEVYSAEDLVSRAAEPVFEQVQSGQTYRSPVKDVDNGEHIIELSLPLVDPASQRLQAVLVAEIHLLALTDNVLNYSIGTRGSMYVIDNQGRIISHNDVSLVLSSAKLPSLTMVGKTVPYANVAGEQVFGAATAVTGTDWLVVAERPMAEIMAPIYEMRKILVGLVLACLLLLTLPLAIFMVSRISRPLGRLERGAVKIGAGEYGEPMPVGNEDEIGRLTRAFNAMAVNLQSYSEEAAEVDWLKTGLSSMDETLRGVVRLEEIAGKAVGFAATYVGAQVGAFYVRSAEDRLVLTGGYAHQDSPGSARDFAIGEGLVGQVARDRKLLVIEDIPGDYLRVSSGLGSAEPASILLMPLLHEGDLVGVMELGRLKPFKALEKTFLVQISAVLAVAVNTAHASCKLQKALERSRQMSEELQAQQEELRVSNEELEEQTRQLQASEEQLKSQQEELRAANEEMQEQAQTLEERQKDLAEKNSSLQIAQNRLEENARKLEISNRYKSEFLANMSHELRTPLNSLLILSRDLMANKGGNLNDDQVESAGVIYQSGNDLLNLISEILDLSKIESGKMSLSVSDTGLAEVRGRLESNFRHMAQAKGVDLEVVVTEELPAVIHTDPQRFEQILKNLLSNAIKFTEQGSVRVRFFQPDSRHDLSNSNLEPQSTLGVAVADTGVGIPADKLDEIFEAFQQVDGTISRRFGGTGLGLSISRELTRVLGGELHVSSEEGKGSTFTLFLPLQYSKPPEPIIQKTAPPAQASQQVHSPPVAKVATPSLPDDRDDLQKDERLVLIIEDDLNFAKILGDLCRDKGFRFLYASNAEDGLILIEKYPVSGVFLDIKLPGIQGLDLLDILKKNRALRHIPVHVMSGDDRSTEAQRLGALSFLSKPVDQEGLEKAFASIEKFSSERLRKLLVVEDDANQRKSIIKLIDNDDIEILVAKSGKQAMEALQTEQVDCMILDLNLPDISGLELLRQLDAQADLHVPPTIVYTGQELSMEEVEQLRSYTSSIIVKGVQSPERLLDEASLFLHRMVSSLPAHKQKMIEVLYDSDEVFTGKKILLVDDDMRNVFALSGILGRRGFEVFKAANGVKALEMLAVEPKIDLVLMDIMMPVMDGYEAMRRIREQPQFARLPILALTAKAMSEDRSRCIQAGANDYLAKPVDIERLLSLLRVWLHR